MRHVASFPIPNELSVLAGIAHGPITREKDEIMSEMLIPNMIRRYGDERPPLVLRLTMTTIPREARKDKHPADPGPNIATRVGLNTCEVGGRLSTDVMTKTVGGCN